MLDQTSQQSFSAAAPPASSGCTELPSLQRHWALSCPTPPAGRSPLCRLQSQIRSLPIRRRCLPDIGRQRRLFFVPFAAFGLLQRHGMDKPAFQQLQAQLVKRPPVESLRATGGCTLEIHRQVLKGRLRGQRADASTGHAEAFAADSCSDLLVFLLDMNNAPFVIDSVFISLSLTKGAYQSETGVILCFFDRLRKAPALLAPEPSLSLTSQVQRKS